MIEGVKVHSPTTASFKVSFGSATRFSSVALVQEGG